MAAHNVYLFSLAMGLVSVLLVYFDSYQNSDRKPRCSYIKVFIGGSIVSLVTAIYFTKGGFSFITSSSNIPSPNHFKIPPQQQILTGSPDF